MENSILSYDTRIYQEFSILLPVENQLKKRGKITLCRTKINLFRGFRSPQKFSDHVENIFSHKNVEKWGKLKKITVKIPDFPAFQPSFNSPSVFSFSQAFFHVAQGFFPPFPQPAFHVSTV